MPEVQECFNRRYKDLDELIYNITARSSNQSRGSTGDKADDPGIKLMCDFWGILKENPDYDLSRAVKQRLGLARSTASPRPYAFNRNFCVYPANKSTPDKLCDKSCDQSEATSETTETSDPGMQGCDNNDCCYKPPETAPPLNKTLKKLKEAASCEKRCATRIDDLINTQKGLQEKIKNLETRELQGIELLKEADTMWCKMEGTYKTAIEDSLKKQHELISQLKDIETNNSKWRRTIKDLDGQLITVSKKHKETIEKISQKSNDIMTLDSEIVDFKRRIENNNKVLAGEKTVITQKKKASEDKIAALNADLTMRKKKLVDAINNRLSKESEGQRYVKQAREDLQNINKLLLQKTMEYEDTKAENEKLEQELELIKETCDQCKDRCKLKKETLVEDIKKVTEEIDNYKSMCKKCHQHTDTDDALKLCSDCPRCKELCRCKLNDEYCEYDPTMDCVCTDVKEKLLDNVFENMYTVLERKAKSKQGKAIAEAVMNSLKNSRNGKLNNEMRSLLHDFVLNGVKKNLNLTIEGGAVKTRCEMDADVHNQLMLCLNSVVIVKPPKEDKSVPAKKESCNRWGATSECNCPGGTKSCICSKLGPPPTKEPKKAPPVENKINEESDEVVLCPHKKAITACGPDCAKRETLGADHDVAAWRPDPCSESVCPFGKNVRAAQCVLGTDVLNAETTTAPSISLHEVDVVDTFELSEKNCTCRKCESRRCSDPIGPRNVIIEEVMGPNSEVTPIEKVSDTMNKKSSDSFYDSYIKLLNKNEKLINKNTHY